MEAPTEAPTTPRKTCDNCYLRKIRCDRQRPRCSHCVVYMTQCTYTAPSRPSRPRKRPFATGKSPETANLRAFVEKLQTQVVDLTRRLDEATDSNRPQKRQPPLGAETVCPQTDLTLSSGDDLRGLNIPGYSMTDLKSAHLPLPPLYQVMPVIQIFLDNVNAVIPLFHPGTLLGLVNNWYELPNHRDPVSWAAINIVLALTYRQAMVSGLGIENGTDLALDHLNKAQSVISDVLIGDTTLLNVQVLLGIVTMLQISKNLKPALVLMGAAMRLAHDLGLHTRASAAHLDPEIAKSRAYVFWIAYILDKDLSMRTRNPSIQRDDDVDVDMPLSISSDHHGMTDGKRKLCAGVIFSVSGNATMDFFLSRIRLAIIEGGVYDYLYSARSQVRTTEERDLALDSLVHALEEWKSHIPPEFATNSASKNTSSTTLSFLCTLHATNFACIAMINQASAWNQQWVMSLSQYSRISTEPQSNFRWDPLVKQARDFTVLFESVPSSGYGLIWETICSYLTAVMLLAANNAYRPFAENVLVDIELTKKAIQFVDNMFGNGIPSESDQIFMVRNACVELNHAVLRRHYEKFGRA